MRHSRRYDFQGHPRSGQGQEMTPVPSREYFNLQSGCSSWHPTNSVKAAVSVIKPTDVVVFVRAWKQVPLFGPLFDGAVVDFASLPGLVRETAINAGNMIRTLRPNYCTLYPLLTCCHSTVNWLTVCFSAQALWQAEMRMITMIKWIWACVVKRR